LLFSVESEKQMTLIEKISDDTQAETVKNYNVSNGSWEVMGARIKEYAR
jgi:hypothetical protein